MIDTQPDEATAGRPVADAPPGGVADAIEALERAERWSPFLATCIARDGDVRARIGTWLDDPLAAVAIDSDRPVASALRFARRRLALIVAIGDLSGRFDLTRTTRLLSDFADRALDTAIGTAIAERVPGAPNTGLAAIALGKQGSRELNYSSDIDPILLFDPATLPRRERDEPQEAAVRIGRRVVELLQARDGDGYVLRVDLRLRPSPEITPIVLPIEAAIGYYESQALPWERAAFIRARAAAGDVVLGEGFLATIRPFVWRRALDFGTIREIRGISRRVRDHYAQGQRFGPGYDLKRGRGGIREIEFFAQIHQLIHGGREPALRAPATRDALAALASAGRIDSDDAVALAEAYTLFRTIEHRVQMIDDRQTHALPAAGEPLDRVARLHGLADGDALLDLLRPHVERVGEVYDALDAEPGVSVAVSAAPLEAQLAVAGFDDAPAAVQRIEAWRGGAYPALRSAAAQSALEAVLPALIAAIGEAPDANAALMRLDAMLSRLPSAINTLRLIAARPALLALLTAILAHAPTLAEALGRRAGLLDGLIDATAFDPAGSVAALADEMRAGEAGDDYQRLLDHVRRVVGEKRFALGAQIVAGAADPLEVSAGYARVAEAAIEVLTAATVTEFETKHGRVPDSELVILALGRMGGAALTHASDLDLIYLFTGDFAGESDGEKPLGAVLYYNRLAQRVTAALSVATASGPLYEIDTRLRPSGASGPLVVSLDGFERYQRESAWTWEHMALTRARAIFGSPPARAAVDAIIAKVLAGDRPERDIVADAVQMRADMAAHKPPAGPLDAKLLDGGLVDLEFAVHVAQLRNRAGFDPHLGRAIDALVAAGLLPASLRRAHDFLSRLLVTLRLVAPDAQPPAPATRALVARALAIDDWDGVLACLDATRQDVRAAWAQVTGDDR
ncbi:bifunctional [glutamate--ammonia ligase]-adenylyl-L-tyrosine phosphorylase/[glutamate--ammonia-ligase] adenylyltransferase [Sphingomonas donggukensis]|uniref:Bifunctional [glutamate--ammonia ligase]-adenylyl-L-tyrosine phosphorylase/[glutamate--ammonia-ligase] adenylyltransferase n=1 Tax=Sphingomonas donggukensis TaxID=2949093 RepID=A0ABY4TX19_9SPHN|nr:bifunctional [glutamate--ammonia ligase]-adenylyl-L-tyrosine phosphorylase/[glutamate--ammonia-ligase] adenylyltransferase [Sphingomonas donggukensis]URW76893.1 bifunctional [glutamate--ammonia ligase]-adenylyl-L-tyrosine phosphorylase/[glutamate--ammonia-ligase] adenylyltransferase [Sphingomonas donggukensis]